MLIFTDFHHAGLLNSLIMLFEGRLGGEVYRPIGREWYDRGYWKVYDHPATVEQFLGIGGATPDGTPPLNDVEGEPTPGIYWCHDIDSGFVNKAITFERFLAMPFDILIASIPQHVDAYKKLAQLHPNHPKVIFQIGNAWTTEAATAPNIMASAVIHNVPPEINFISYHQEFDLNIFYPDLNYPGPNIYSFVNCFDTADIFREDWYLFQLVEKTMTDWKFRAYGGQCRDGSANGAHEVANKMREARFVWHTKRGGDGYGHIIHNAPAVARPLVVKKEYYHGKMAEPLLIDGVTCIAIDGLSYTQIINKMVYYSDPNEYSKMCIAAYNNFKTVVNFDAEQKAIETYLSKLL